jgi:dipeptide/tripeptide permease
VIALWFVVLDCAAELAASVGAMTAVADWVPAILRARTEADQALWSAVLNLWFLGRLFDRVGPVTVSQAAIELAERAAASPTARSDSPPGLPLCTLVHCCPTLIISMLMVSTRID